MSIAVVLREGHPMSDMNSRYEAESRSCKSGKRRSTPAKSVLTFLLDLGPLLHPANLRPEVYGSSTRSLAGQKKLPTNTTSP